MPVPGTDARIVDMEGGSLTLPPGKMGELVVQGPQVMHGYWRRPDETASALRNGWLYTGDLATMCLKTCLKASENVLFCLPSKQRVRF